LAILVIVKVMGMHHS